MNALSPLIAAGTVNRDSEGVLWVAFSELGEEDSLVSLPVESDAVDSFLSELCACSIARAIREHRPIHLRIVRHD